MFQQVDTSQPYSVIHAGILSCDPRIQDLSLNAGQYSTKLSSSTTCNLAGQ